MLLVTLSKEDNCEVSASNTCDHRKDQKQPGMVMVCPAFLIATKHIIVVHMNQAQGLYNWVL